MKYSNSGYLRHVISACIAWVSLTNVDISNFQLTWNFKVWKSEQILYHLILHRLGWLNITSQVFIRYGISQFAVPNTCNICWYCMGRLERQIKVTPSITWTHKNFLAPWKQWDFPSSRTKLKRWLKQWNSENHC